MTSGVPLPENSNGTDRTFSSPKRITPGGSDGNTSSVRFPVKNVSWASAIEEKMLGIGIDG